MFVPPGGTRTARTVIENGLDLIEGKTEAGESANGPMRRSAMRSAHGTMRTRKGCDPLPMRYLQPRGRDRLDR